METVEKVLYWEYLDNTVLRWLVALGVVLVVALTLRFVLPRVARRLEKLTARTHTSFDDVIVHALLRTRTFFLIALGVLTATLFVLALPESVSDKVRALVVIATLIQMGIWLSDGLIYTLERRRTAAAGADPDTSSAMLALRFVGRFAIWTIIGLLILDNLGVDVTALVAGLGIGGIAVALALQSLLSDLLASLTILIDKPFVLGDFIVVGDFAGSVENIGLKTTRLRSLGGEQLIFANSDLLSSRVRNYRRMQERRIAFTVTVPLGTPRERLGEAKVALREAVEGVEQTRFDRAHFKRFTEYAIEFEVVYYVLSADYNVYMDIQEAINLGICQRFDAAQLAFAVPARVIHMAREGEGEGEGEGGASAWRPQRT